MTDLRDRFKMFDDVPAPDLWHEVEARAGTPVPSEISSRTVVLIAAMLLLALAVAGAALVGSGIVKLPVTVEASTAPSPSPTEGTVAAWRLTGSMAGVHEGHTAILLPDGTVLVAGGPAGEIYDPDGESWTATAPMVENRYGHSATLLPGGRVLVAGGAMASQEVMTNSAELYSAERGWTAIADMAQRRTDHTATLLLDGRVLVAGGATDYELGIAVPTVELYDPRTDTWNEASSMHVARSNHAATLLPDGTVLVTGGANEATAELYDPVRDEWTLQSMLAIRVDHTATMLPDGAVLVAGGSGSPSGRGPTPDDEYPGELYDPSLGTWTTTAGMIWPRDGHTATLLPDGRVLVVGGAGFGRLTAQAELYDPASRSWIGTVSMSDARWNHTATLLRDGTVLVSAGYAGGGVTLDSAELYDPRGGS